MLHNKCSTVNSKNVSFILYQIIPDNSWKKFRLLLTYMKKTKQPKPKNKTEKQLPGIGAREKTPINF